MASIGSPYSLSYTHWFLFSRSSCTILENFSISSKLNFCLSNQSVTNLSKTSQLSSHYSNDFQDYDYDYEFNEEDLNAQIGDTTTAFVEEKDLLQEREKMILEATEKLFL